MKNQKLIWIFVLIGIGVAVIPLILRKTYSYPLPGLNNELNIKDKKELLSKAINSFNQDCPRKIGTIGQMDSITLTQDTLQYHYSVYGSSKIDDYYQAHYKEIKTNLLYLFSLMNGQDETGHRLVNLFDNCGLITQINFRTPSNEVFSWGYSAKEINDFFSKNHLSPEEALLKFLEFQIDIDNSQLPVVWGSIGDLTNIQSLSLNSIVSDYDILEEIKLKGNDITLYFTTPENGASIYWLKSQTMDEKSVEKILKFFCKDPNFRELIVMFAVTKVNLKLNYYGTKSKDFAEVTFPYPMLRKYAHTWGYSLN